MHKAICLEEKGILVPYLNKEISLDAVIRQTGARTPKELSKYRFACPCCGCRVYPYGSQQIITGVKINLGYENAADEITGNKKYSTEPGFRHYPDPGRPACKLAVEYEKSREPNAHGISEERRKEVLAVLQNPDNHTKYIAAIMSFTGATYPHEAERIASAWKEKSSNKEFLKDHDWFYPYLALMLEKRVTYTTGKGKPLNVIFEPYKGGGEQTLSFSSPYVTEKTGQNPTVTLPNKICIRLCKKDGTPSRALMMRYKGAVLAFRVAKDEVEKRMSKKTILMQDGTKTKRAIPYQQTLFPA